MTELSRRALLAGISSGSGVSLIAGCAGRDTGDDPADTTAVDTTAADTTTATPTETPLPDDCPTTRGLDVEPPAEVDADAAVSFVDSYEAVYYRDVVVEYEPSSRLDSYEPYLFVDDEREPVDDGYVVSVEGGGAIYHPRLHVEASVEDPPAERDVIPVEDVDDESLTDLLRDAEDRHESDDDRNDGSAAMQVGPGSEVDRYLDVVDEVSDRPSQIKGPGDSTTVYFAVDDTTVELSVRADRFHGDLLWWAWYYVDDHVVRRTVDRETDPLEGELLECRE